MIDDLGFDTEDVRVQTEGWVQTMKELQAVVIAAEADYGTPLKDLIIIQNAHFNVAFGIDHTEPV